MADDDLSRLTDDEKTALAALLKRTIDSDRFPLSPRIGTLRGILAKLQPPKPKPTPPPPVPHHAPPRAKPAQRRARRPIASILAAAVALTWTTPGHAKEWFMLDVGGNRCMDGATTAADAMKSGLPPISSPYDATQMLGREHLSFTTHVTRDARGEVNAVEINMEGSSSTFWFRSRAACESFRERARSKGMAAPVELK